MFQRSFGLSWFCAPKDRCQVSWYWRLNVRETEPAALSTETPISPKSLQSCQFAEPSRVHCSVSWWATLRVSVCGMFMSSSRLSASSPDRACRSNGFWMPSACGESSKSSLTLLV
ncbi:hypothetical protein D3C87_1622060 [compost metagenome]